jgi:hypothetical protein
MRFLRSTFDAVLNRSAEELIGALFITLAVAIVVAGLYALGRRKSSPSPTFVGGLALGAGALCMALAAGYIEYVETDRLFGSGPNRPAPVRRRPGGTGQVIPPPPRGFWSSGFHVVVAADENRDGRLTPEEVARLVRKADTDGDGSVNFQDIDRLIASRFKPPSQSSAHTSAGPNDRGPGDGPPDNGRGKGSSDDDGPLRDE